jgi:hypothetical protein
LISCAYIRCIGTIQRISQKFFSGEMFHKIIG